MTQRELNEAVARATGEDLQTIRSYGFSDASPRVIYFDDELLTEDEEDFS